MYTMNSGRLSCVSAGLSLAKNVPFGGVMLVMVVGEEFHV